MKLQIALPASALLVVFSAAAWVRAPHSPDPSPRRLVARAGIGAISAIASAGESSAAPERSQSAAPLTLSASRPDEVAPADGTGDVATIERYHERAIRSARSRSAAVVVDPAGGRVPRASVVVDFERKCERSADGTKKPKCNTSALELPVVGCYLQQAAAAMLS